MTTEERQDWMHTLTHVAVVLMIGMITYDVNKIENQIANCSPVRPAPPDPGPNPTPSPNPSPNPNPIPVPQTQLAKAGQGYHFGASAEYASLRDQVKSGSIKTAQQVADFMASVAKPFGDQIKVTVAANCDQKGNITSPSVLAAEFDALSKAVEVK